MEVKFRETLLGIFENPREAKKCSFSAKDHYPGQNAVVSFVVDNVEEMHKKLDLDGFVSESITSPSGGYFIAFCFMTKMETNSK